VRGRLARLFLLLLLCSACARTPLDDGFQQGLANEPAQSDAGSPPPSPAQPTAPSIWFEPGDLLAVTTVTPIRALMEGADLATVEAVAAEVQLHEYPSLKPVDVTVSIQLSDRQTVELAPKVPLAQTWHVVSLKRIPPSLVTSPDGAPSPPIGAYANRFHPGSAPILRRVRFCETADGVRNTLFFSQNTQPG